MSATSMGRRLLQVRGGGTETIYKAAIELCVALHVVICGDVRGRMRDA